MIQTATLMQLTTDKESRKKKHQKPMLRHAQEEMERLNIQGDRSET